LKELSPSSKRALERIEADPSWRKYLESDARKAEYIRSVAQPKMRISGVHKESGLKNLLLAKKQKEMEAYNRMMGTLSEGYQPRVLSPKAWDKVDVGDLGKSYKEVMLKHPSKDAPNYPLAIIRALMDEEGGDDYIPAEGFQEGGYIPSWKDYKAGVGSARLMESAGEDPLSGIKLGLGAAGTIPGMAGIASDVASAGLSIGQGKFKEGIGSLASAVDPTGFLGAAQTGMSLWDRFSGKQYGGEVQYMQGGGFPDFASLFQPSGGMAKIARAGKLRKAYKDVGRRARQIGKKQGLSRLFGTVGELGGKFIGSAFGPAGSAIGAGLGRGLGSMLGYGKKVGAGASKWLSGAREQLRSSESGIGKSFLEQGLASGIKTGVVGAIDSGAFKDLGDKFKTKLGTLRHGESPVAGVGESLKTSEYGKVLSQDPEALTVDKFKAMRPKDPFEYAGKTSLVPNVEAVSASAPTQLDMPLRGAGFDFTDPFSASDVQQASFGEYGGKFPEHLKWENFDPYQLTSGGRDRGEYGFQGGGYVRDDMALLDMIYRR